MLIPRDGERRETGRVERARQVVALVGTVAWATVQVIAVVTMLARH